MRNVAVVTVGMFLAGATLFAVAAEQDRAVDRAFTHYERIRAALAQDTTKGVAAEAQALAPVAAEVAGSSGRSAAESLAQAEDLAEARNHFGSLSEALVRVPRSPPLRRAGLRVFNESEALGAARRHGGQPVHGQSHGYMRYPHQEGCEAGKQVTRGTNRSTT